ncbi:hypothetical protein NESM_000060000 [Novymonas esmeraldas]|uniref:Uncharacterized protein n=1 Tax=Novymonas esmeraldas TaxID=1808958 RepID=A0AAW0F2I6_9TRYP
MLPALGARTLLLRRRGGCALALHHARRRRSTAASSGGGGGVLQTAPSASASPPPSTASALSSCCCPTAAILVDAGSSARTTLPMCLGTVQETVRAHLRSQLTERLLTPLLSKSVTDVLAQMNNSAANRERSRDSADDAMVTFTAAAIHGAASSPSRLRYLAFSHEHPQLRHPSWAPVWAPGSSWSACASSRDGDTGGAAVASAAVIHTTAVCRGSGGGGGEAEVEHALGDTTPLLGPDACGAFIAVTAASTNASTGAVVTYWERWRVDAFIPPCVQVQAAVRHVLRRRRPTAAYTASLLSRSRPAFALLPPTPARPVAVVAVVSPDHLTEAYSAFLDLLQQERRAVLLEQANDSGGGPVRLLLFNTSGLVRVVEAA